MNCSGDLRRARQGLRWLILATALLAAGCPDRPPGKSEGEEGPQGPPWLEDVTARVKLDFVNDPGPDEPRYFMPRSMGSGGAALDFDGDGRLDLYLIQGGGPKGKKNQLFHQEADGTFRDVSAGSGLDVAGWGHGVAVGDVTNDGRPDVVVTEYGATRLFVNQGQGKFREVTREAGIDNPLWGTSGSFVDYDQDGWLDLVVANYVDYNPSAKCLTAGRTDFCGPMSFNGSEARLWRNLGPGPDGVVRFADVTVKAGLSEVRGKGLGVLCADFDGDGRPDLFLANDGMANHLWINRGDGTFRDEAVSRGIAYTSAGQMAANMGVAWGDVDGDGLNDVFVTHLVLETHTLWKQGPRGMFQDRTVAAGLTRGWRGTGFGTAFVDLDRDGWLDLAWVNGDVRKNRDADPSGPFWAAYAQRNQLFVNSGEGKFRDVSISNPALCGKPVLGRGLIVADLDNDGAPDLVTTEIAGPARVLRNIAPANGRWLAVRALLPKSGRDACGADVVVKAGGREFRRLIQPGCSYCCSNDPRAHFGLGPADSYDELRVLWPDGTAERFPGGPANREVTVRQGQGTKVK